MIKAQLFFDHRRPDKEGRGHLRIVIVKNGTRAIISLGISLFPEQWKEGVVVNHKDAKLLNSLISIKKGMVDRTILEQVTLGAFVGKTASEVADVLRGALDPDIEAERKRKEKEVGLAKQSVTIYFEKYIDVKSNTGTRNLYRETLRKIEAYCSSLKMDSTSLTFDAVDKAWLVSFETFCLQTESQNTASRHLRDIRAVFNAAIDEKLTVNYPFRRFRIKCEESRDKSYTAAELRALFSAKCYPGGEQEAVDIFKLMFCLIGINSVDLANASQASRGRLDYIRAKTHKRYSVKVEPEAQEIIRKYAGKSRLLDVLERCPNYKTYFNRLGKTLRKVGKTRVSGKKSIGKAILPEVCLGAARTSWATIAQSELDIPRDVIAAALGHHTIDVTSTYLRTEWTRKVDEANRKVLDWVFYGK